MTNQQQDIEPTFGEQITDLFARVAKLNDQMAAVLAPDWGARMGIIPEGHPLHPGPGPEETDTTPADDLTGYDAPDPPIGCLTPVVEPAEHCGDQLPALIGSSRTECVLRPGHSGSHADRNGARWINTVPEPAADGLREQIAAAIAEAAGDRWPAQAFLTEADAVLAVILPNTRITASIARDAEATVQRVIDLYERWLKAGAPPLGTSMARWWDTRLAELHAALEPPKEQP